MLHYIAGSSPTSTSVTSSCSTAAISTTATSAEPASIVSTTITTTSSSSVATIASSITTTSPVVEKSGADTFPRGARNYATLQPVSKRSIGTETDAGEIDHYSDDEAPLASPRGRFESWVGITS